ncbi:MAG: class II fructose-bisphosphate aldolase [Chloroflexi bacterium]|nr:class II fructose-bisphosphate aldolase [Chloroflexota bacterium]
MTTRPTNSDSIDALVGDAVFGVTDTVKGNARQAIKETALSRGIVPSSIIGLYEAAGKGFYSNITVPAINIRGLTYHVAKAVFRAAMKNNAGAIIFEIARSEIGYTGQRPAEYAACVLAASIKEGFQGPVFLQGDHYQVNRGRYNTTPEEELKAIEALIRESVEASFYNIDIDASTIVDIDKKSLEEQQEKNCQVTAHMTRFIRSIEPRGTAVSVGGEIGEVGKRNSTPDDLRAFMAGFSTRLGADMKGISKISVQTGTTHGGVVLPNGSIAQVEVDFKTLAELSRVAREEFGLGGAVQHGASTLPDEAFDMFPKANTAEIHLATGFQNIIYDSQYFPADLLAELYGYLREKHSDERESGETDEQFYYKTRKRALGPFKKQLWGLPQETINGIMAELEERFSLLFHKLNVVGTAGLVNKYIAMPTMQR